MRFFISRTSSSHGINERETERPCEEATLTTYIHRDIWAVDDPRKMSGYRSDPEEGSREWYGKGTNHRIENGQIVRDREMREAWQIEINSLQDLTTLQKKYGELILRKHSNTGEPEIEIYDSYRE